MSGNPTQRDDAPLNDANSRALPSLGSNSTVREVEEQLARESDELEQHYRIQKAKRRAAGWLTMFEAMQWCDSHGWIIAYRDLQVYANLGILRVKPIRRRLSEGGSVFVELLTREEWLRAFIQEGRTTAKVEMQGPYNASCKEFDSRLMAFACLELDDMTDPVLRTRRDQGMNNAILSCEGSFKDIFAEFLGPSPTVRDKKDAGRLPMKYARANQSALLFQPSAATIEQRARRFIAQHSNRLAVAHLAFDDAPMPYARYMYIVWCLDHKTDPDTGGRRVCEKWIERERVLREHNLPWVNHKDARLLYATLSSDSKKVWLRALQQALSTPSGRQKLLRCSADTEAALVASAILRLLRVTRAAL